MKLPREFELGCPKGNVRTEADEIGRQAEPHRGDEAVLLSQMTNQDGQWAGKPS